VAENADASGAPQPQSPRLAAPVHRQKIGRIDPERFEADADQKKNEIRIVGDFPADRYRFVCKAPGACDLFNGPAP